MSDLRVMKLRSLRCRRRSRGEPRCAPLTSLRLPTAGSQVGFLEHALRRLQLASYFLFIPLLDWPA